MVCDGDLGDERDLAEPTFRSGVLGWDDGRVGSSSFVLSSEGLRQPVFVVWSGHEMVGKGGIKGWCKGCSGVSVYGCLVVMYR